MHRNRTWNLDPPEWRTQRNRLLPIEGGDGSIISWDFKSEVLDWRLYNGGGSVSTYVNKLGILTSASYGYPRFDYHPTTKEFRGLLVEHQVANVAARSEAFTNTYWVKSNITAVDGGITSPTGGTNASSLTETFGITSLVHYVTTSTVSTSIVTNTPYTMSIWVKLPTFGNVGRYIQLAFGTPRFGTNAYMNYDLGSVPASVGNGGASITNATITAYNDGWYRLTATATSIAQGINPAFQIGFATSINSVRNETTIVPESNQKTIWIYGPQMERGSCATSFILTRTSGTTRQADRYDFDSTDFFTDSGLQGTFYLRGTVINPTATVSGSTLLFAFMEDNGFAVGTSPSIDVGIAAANSNRPFLHAFVSTNTDVDISVPLFFGRQISHLTQ